MDFIIIPVLGKVFHDLAKEFDKNKWLFAVLGVVSFYICSFTLNILFAFLSVKNGNLNTSNLTILSYLAIILSLVVSLIFFIVLKKKWEHARLIKNREIRDVV